MISPSCTSRTNSIEYSRIITDREMSEVRTAAGREGREGMRWEENGGKRRNERE
jgi:hypothetical protein